MTRNPSQGGFTLIELLISLAIALMATLAICQTFAVSESYRRTSTSGGDAQFAGAVGVYVIANDLRMSGYGINNPTYLGCTVSGFDAQQNRNISFTLAPALITAGATNTIPDSITIVGGNSNTLTGALSLSTAMATPNDNYQVTNSFGIYAGDVLVLAQVNQPCTMAQSTIEPVTQSVGAQLTVTHGTGTYKNSQGVTVHARYNDSGLGPAYSAAGVLMDLGAAPIVNRYYLLNNTLYVDQLVSGQLQQPVAANIVQMKIYYGVSTAGDGAVEAWTQTTPATAAAWANVLAVRIALAAQSQNPEKPSTPGGACTTTTNFPVVTWDDGTTTTLDVSGANNWQCFRYKVFHMSVSLLNQIWAPT